MARSSHKSLPPIRSQRSRSLGLPPPTTNHYHEVRQRQWGTWVAEITDHNTGCRNSIGIFQSARQVAWAHDIKNVELHGSDCGPLNFPLGQPGEVPEFFSPPSSGRAADIAREDREARERLDAEAASERYMAELRRKNPDRALPGVRHTSRPRLFLLGGAGPSSAWSAAGPSYSATVAASSSVPAQEVIDLGDSYTDSTDSFDAWLDSLGK